MINRYSIFACIAVFIVGAAYFINFHFILQYRISNDHQAWSSLGSYFGGVLGPILSFISLILLIKSLTLQNAANENLTHQLRNSEKTEKIRSFETLFFNMVGAQKELFSHFQLEIRENNQIISKTGVDAVIAIEDEFEKFPPDKPCDEEKRELLSQFDSKDQLYDVVRGFSVIVKIISEKLSDDQGFSVDDRKAHIHILINCSSFAQLRLLLMCMQFMDNKHIACLKSNNDLIAVFDEVGLKQLY